MSLLTLGSGWRAVGNGGRRPVSVSDVNWPISPFDSIASYVPEDERPFLSRIDWPNVVAGAVLGAAGFLLLKRYA